METIGIHESPRCALDDRRFYQYFLLFLLFFFSYLFYILISCFSIKHAAVIELIEDEGSIVKRTMNYHCFNYIIDESFLRSMEHQTLSILKNSVLILLYVYMLFVESKREFFN